MISPINRTKVMSRESPFLGLSSVLNKISQKTLPFNSRPSQTSKNNKKRYHTQLDSRKQVIAYSQEYWSVASFVHLQLLKKPTKNYNGPKILEKAHK